LWWYRCPTPLSPREAAAAAEDVVEVEYLGVVRISAVVRSVP